MEVRFDCTQCGKCCHDLKLPLSVSEAIRWARQGHQVQFLCDALPDLGEPETADVGGRYRYERSIASRTGTLPIRVYIILVASHTGACPHLGADMRCSDYDERPRVCRIYPAEIAPHVVLDPDTKKCPPDAWDDDRALFFRGDHLVSVETHALIEAHRRATRDDVPAKVAACHLLGIDAAALGNEGYAVHAPEPARAAEILERVSTTPAPMAPVGRWTVVTNRHTTLAMLDDAGAQGVFARAGADYLAFFPDED